MTRKTAWGIRKSQTGIRVEKNWVKKNIFDQALTPSLINLEMGKDPRELFDLKERIGKGSFGEVHRAIDKSTKKEVAIKIIDLEKSDGKKVFRR